MHIMIPPPDDIEKLVLEALDRGGEEGIELLFKHYYGFVASQVFRILPNKFTTDDICQEVFLDLWKRRETSKNIHSLKGYLRKTAVNRALNFIRDQKKHQHQSTDHLQRMAAGETNHNIGIETDELRQVLQKEIMDLPEKCRQVFILSRYEDKSYKEIAAELSISEKTVENQISKALKRLREVVKKFKSMGLLNLL